MGKRARYTNGDVALIKSNGWWLARYTHQGKRKRTQLVEVSRPEREARDALDRFCEMRRAVVTQQKREHSISDLWELWLKDREKDGLDNNIYTANWVALKPFFGNRTPDLLTRDDCREYAKLRFSKGRAAGTVHTELIRLRACLNWAYRDNLIAKPIHVWAPSTSKPREVVLTVDEAKALLKASERSDPHIKLFIHLLFLTGGRHKAILDLTWDRINFEEEYIDLDDKPVIDPMHRRRKKGRAKIWMSEDARKLLELAHSGALTNYVIEHGGKRLVSCREGFSNAVERSGIKKNVTPHTIRHTIATWLFNGETDTKFTARLLGHRNVRTTEQIYQHPAHEDTRSVVEQLAKKLPIISH